MQSPPPAPDDDHLFSINTHSDSREVGCHHHKPPALFASTSSPPSWYGVSEDPTANLIPLNTTPHPRWGDLPVARDYPLESKPPLFGMQYRGHYGTSHHLRWPGGDPSRPGATRPSFSIQLLTVSPAEQGSRGKKRESPNTSLVAGITIQNEAGPSGSRFITLVRSCGT